jgi:hypothetical protein
MQETTFVDENGYVVTNARFVTPSATYAMSGVQSIRILVENPNILLKYGLLILGGFWSLGLIMIPLLLILLLFNPKSLGDGTSMIWAFLGIIGAFMLLKYRNMKSKYILTLSLANSEVSAVVSHNSAFIQKLAAALNEAIIHRG